MIRKLQRRFILITMISVISIFILILAVLNISENQDAAEAFLDYLKTDDCMKVFEEVGFTAVK